MCSTGRPCLFHTMRLLLIIFLGLLIASPGCVFAADNYLNASRNQIAPGEEATLSWVVQGAERCESAIDYINSKGQWVWTLSDPWHSTDRSPQGTFTVVPERSSRYHIFCKTKGKTVELATTVTVGEQHVKKTENAPQPLAVILPAVPPKKEPSFGQGKADTPVFADTKEQKKEEKKELERQKPEVTRAPELQKEVTVPSNQKDTPPTPLPTPPPVSDNAPAVAKKLLMTRSLTKEEERRARDIFLRLYKRVAVSERKSDLKALRLLSGVDKPVKQNLKAEKTARTQFMKVFKKNPHTSVDWRAVHALSYSGARLMKDSDKDLLSDEDERRFKSNPKKKDTDGDGYSDGLEVDHGYSPIKSGKKAKATP